MVVGSASLTSLDASGNVTISGITTLTDLNSSGDVTVSGDALVSGVGTINTLYSSGGNIVAGVSTLGIATVTSLNSSGDVSILGDTTIARLSSSGDAVFTGILTAHTLNSVGDASFTGITSINTLNSSGNATFTGILTAHTLNSVGDALFSGVTTTTSLTSVNSVFSGITTTNHLESVDSNLTGITTISNLASGISTEFVAAAGIQSGGVTIGTATTLNFVGSGVTSVTIADNVAEVFIGISTVIYEKQVNIVSVATSEFNFDYNPGATEVYYNGSKLVGGTDYAATDGSVIQLTFDAVSGDTVEIITFTNTIASLDRSFWSSYASGISTTSNVKVGVNTSAGVVLTSANGTNYRLYVENDGTLKTELES